MKPVKRRFQGLEEVDLVQCGKRELEQVMEIDWMAAEVLRIELEQQRRCFHVCEYAGGVDECAHAGVDVDVVEGGHVGDREGLAGVRWRKMKRGRFANVAVGREAEIRCRLCYLDDSGWIRRARERGSAVMSLYAEAVATELSLASGVCAGASADTDEVARCHEYADVGGRAAATHEVRGHKERLPIQSAFATGHEGKKLMKEKAWEK